MRYEEKPKCIADIKAKKAVVINGLRQNCYVLDTCTNFGKSNTPPVMKRYPSLETKKLPNGYIECIEEKDYPITSESVTSYVAGSDYKRDPLSAIQNAPKRVNLGDVSQVQEFLRDNPHEAVKILRNVSKSLTDYLENNKSNNNENKESEVVNNE